MAEQTILVLGATGTTGRRVTSMSRAAGLPVRAASRVGEPPFDWAAPETWEPATADVSGLYLMAPDGVPIDPSFVNFAVEQGVRHLVLLSSRGIEVMGDQRLMAAEQTVRDCGAEWTIVRPAWFNQNFDEGAFREAVMAGELTLPLGELRQAFIDADDIAAVAAAALTETGHAGQSYELTGPRALSFAEALQIISRAIDREVVFRGSAEEFLAEQSALGISREEAMSVVEAFDALRGLGDDEPTDVVQRVTGRPPKTFESYVAAAASRRVWRG